TGDDDPPVWIADPDDPAAPLSRYADTFSDYIRTSIWDHELWQHGAADFDCRLRPDALRGLGREFTGMPTTWSWAANQDCERIVRFTGAADIAIALDGDTVLWVVVRTD